MVASRPSLRCNPRKKPVSCQGRRGFGHGVWSPTFVTIQWLWSQLCYMTAANQWAVGQIELLAKVGWKRNCQSFSCPCSLNVMHCRTETCSTWFDMFVSGVHSCHFFGKCQASAPDKKLEVPERDSMLHQFCIMPASCPSLRCSWKKKNNSRMQKSKGFGHGVVVSKICYNAVIVLSVVLWDCCKPMNHCRDWAFSKSGLEVGLPVFQLPMFPKCDALPKGDLLDMFV